jgi:hypothetical protein
MRAPAAGARTVRRGLAWPRLLLAAALVLGPLPDLPAEAATPSFPTVATEATLTILGGPVEHASAGAATRRAAVDGMNLNEGDHIVTGPGAFALITFLDGSTITVEPESMLTVRQADVSRPEESGIRLLIHVGKVWARAARLLGRRSSVSLESSTYSATAHDGLIGAEQARDGAFACWTRKGVLALTDRDGRPVTTLAPGQKTTVRAGQPPVTVAFRTNASTLAVTAPPGVLPLLLMPDRHRVAGFVQPGIEVNQVFGSLTVASPDGVRTVEVPAGHPGPFTLFLTGRDDGPVTVAVEGRFQDSVVYRQDVTGKVQRGETLAVMIEQQLASEGADVPATARVAGGRITPPAAWPGPLPGRVLLSPREYRAVSP